MSPADDGSARRLDPARNDNTPVAKRGRRAALPPNTPPLGLSRSEAAAYIGIGNNLFDELVRDGRMPPAKRINGRRVWDRRRLEAAFEALPDDGQEDDIWSRVSV